MFNGQLTALNGGKSALIVAPYLRSFNGYLMAFNGETEVFNDRLPAKHPRSVHAAGLPSPLIPAEVRNEANGV